MALREPCPARIVDDVGGAFAMGCVGGSLWYMVRGFINSPAKERIRGALIATKFRGPIMGGSFAMWGGIFSATDCLLLATRQEDSPINSVIAGFVTGAILSNRNGVAAAWRSGMIGGLILGIIEGVNYLYTVTMLKQQARMMQVMSTLQDERIRRQTAGQPDFTPDELNNMMARAMKGEEIAFKKPTPGPR